MCRTPQLRKLFHCNINLPKVASKCPMISLMTTSSPASFKSSTWIVRIATNFPPLRKMSSSSSVRVGTSLHLFLVICASFKWKHRGASTDPVDGFRLCSTSVAGSSCVAINLFKNSNTRRWKVEVDIPKWFSGKLGQFLISYTLEKRFGNIGCHYIPASIGSFADNHPL